MFFSYIPLFLCIIVIFVWKLQCSAHWTLLVSVQYRVRLFSFVKKLFRFFFLAQFWRHLLLLLSSSFLCQTSFVPALWKNNYAPEEVAMTKKYQAIGSIEYESWTYQVKKNTHTRTTTAKIIWEIAQRMWTTLKR